MLHDKNSNGNDEVSILLHVTMTMHSVLMADYSEMNFNFAE